MKHLHVSHPCIILLAKAAAGQGPTEDTTTLPSHSPLPIRAGGGSQTPLGARWAAMCKHKQGKSASKERIRRQKMSHSSALLILEQSCSRRM